MCLGVMHLLLVSRRSIPYLQSIIELGHGDVDWVDATKTHPHPCATMDYRILARTSQAPQIYLSPTA